MSSENLDFSVVIPVYNEEGILSAAIGELFHKLRESERLSHMNYEVILSANGCRDRTVDIAWELIERYPQLRVIESPEPNYGKALKMGILEAKGRWVVCDEIDLGDVSFYERAIYRLQEEHYDMVVGSKRLERSFDKRPAFRRAASTVINGMLRVGTGFKGTDTHGLKAFTRERLLPVLHACIVEHDMFASEFVIRAGRMNYRVTEIPVEVIEKRAPSIALARRVPRVLRQVALLTWTIRTGRG